MDASNFIISMPCSGCGSNFNSNFNMRFCKFCKNFYKFCEKCSEKLRKKYGKSSEIPCVKCGKWENSDEREKNEFNIDNLIKGITNLSFNDGFTTPRQSTGSKATTNSHKINITNSSHSKKRCFLLMTPSKNLPAENEPFSCPNQPQTPASFQLNSQGKNGTFINNTFQKNYYNLNISGFNCRGNEGGDGGGCNFFNTSNINNINTSPNSNQLNNTYTGLNTYTLLSARKRSKIKNKIANQIHMSSKKARNCGQLYFCDFSKSKDSVNKSFERDSEYEVEGSNNSVNNSGHPTKETHTYSSNNNNNNIFNKPGLNNTFHNTFNLSFNKSFLEKVEKYKKDMKTSDDYFS